MCRQWASGRDKAGFQGLSRWLGGEWVKGDTCRFGSKFTIPFDIYFVGENGGRTEIKSSKEVQPQGKLLTL